MKKLLLLFLITTNAQLGFTQEEKVKLSRPTRILCTIEGEKLTTDELKTRLEYNRILRPVYQEDTLTLNPKNTKTIKSLPVEYVEFTEYYLRVMNSFLKNMNTKQKNIIKNLWTNYKIYTCVIIYYLHVKDKQFVMETTKENLLEIGMTEDEYNEMTNNFQSVNAMNAQAENLIIDERIYKDGMSTIFFQDCYFKLLDGDNRLYNRLKKSFYELIRTFETKQQSKP